MSTDKKDPSHQTRFAWQASTYDEICTACGATDGLGTWSGLAYPCPKESDEHKKERNKEKA